MYLLLQKRHEKNIHKIFLKILENMKIIRLFNFVRISIKLFDECFKCIEIYFAYTNVRILL